MANQSIVSTMGVSGGTGGNSISIGRLNEVYTNASRNTSRRLSEFYYGGNFLRRNECTNFMQQYGRPGRWRWEGIPSSPNTSIRLGNFLNKQYYYAPPNNINADGRNFYSCGDAEALGIKNRALAPAFFTLVNTAERRGASTGEYAYRVNQDNSHPSSTVVFYNYAEIKGRGGDGGNGNSGNGLSSGPALRMNAPAFFRNFSNIWGGGRGGNAGPSTTGTYNECYCCRITRWAAGGNGGGGGAGNGNGGQGGNSAGGNFTANGVAGFGGNWSSPGGQRPPNCQRASSPKNQVCSNVGDPGRDWGGNSGVVFPSAKPFTRLNDGNIRGGINADGVFGGGPWG